MALFHRVWEDVPMYAPKLPGAKLVFSTRKIWRHRKEPLEVRLQLTAAGELTSVGYEGAVSELVRTSHGKIFEVLSTYRLPGWVWPHPDEDVSEEDFHKRVQLCLNPPKTPLPQYLRIKSFEKDLRLLPEQEGLYAIYQGTGFFGKRARVVRPE